MTEPAPAVDGSLENIKQLMDLLRPVVDHASKLTWKVSDGFWLLVCRCVLRRQFDDFCRSWAPRQRLSFLRKRSSLWQKTGRPWRRRTPAE